ncbi:hypothetical protein LTR57_009336 [Friedmanniomyces endolithicus]|nr:hypothetical protein LTR57_009336 [Friedmanniomyces endolithicus]
MDANNCARNNSETLTLRYAKDTHLCDPQLAGQHCDDELKRAGDGVARWGLNHRRGGLTVLRGLGLGWQWRRDSDRPKYKWKTATDPERRDFFFLAQKILDTDISACQHSSLKKFQWHVSVFFVWGSWDSMIFTLTSLRKPEIFSEAETDAAWSRVEQIYANHSKELLVSMQPLQVAIGRITLKAWNVRARSGMAEPSFITSLRSSPKVNPMARTRSYDSGAMPLGSTIDSMSPMGFANGSGELSGDLGAGMGFEYGNDVSNVEDTDWLFWDQLIQDYQAKGG